jgi:N-acetylglucosamine transport system substrate-binding protein
LNGTAVEVDGVFFSGGFGQDYIDNAAKLMMELHPDVTIKVQGIQKVGPQMQPRFVAGNPPDVIDNAGADSLDQVGLINDGQVYDLTALMDAPALDTPGKKFSETLVGGTQEGTVFDGKPMLLNIALGVYGLWYSKTAFEKAGLTYPATWEDFLALGEQLKKDGKQALFTYQGKYPYYIREWVLPTLIYKAGGGDPLLKIDNLEANAWSDPAVKQGVDDLFQLADKGYILAGTSGMTHTESQTAWLQGKALFIPCGAWLENEMKTVTPADFTMAMGPIPGNAGGKGDQNGAQVAGGETYFVPGKAKNPKHGMEFLRVLLSKASAGWFAENIKSAMPVIGGTEGAKVSDALQSALDLASKAGNSIVKSLYGGNYRKMYDEGDILMNNLLTAKIKPDEFTAGMQKLADEILNDPDVKKQKRDTY